MTASTPTPNLKESNAEKQAAQSSDFQISQKRYFLPQLADLIDTRVFFVGMLLGFFLCCLGGYLTTMRNQYGDLPRFGQLVSIEALLEPTLGQLRAIAHDRAREDQILVVIGGDSVLNGTGQREPQLWSKKLQEILGPRYAVVNFALRTASTFEGGYIAAESLANDYKKLIFITDSPPAFRQQAAMRRYDYFYYDGLYKELLENNPERDADFEQRIADTKGKEKTEWHELKLHKLIDSTCYFDDFWNTLGYRHFFTVWNSLAAGHFTQARRQCPDNERETKSEAERMLYLDNDLKIIRSFSEKYFEDVNGRWQPKDDAWEPFERRMRLISENMRKKTLVLIIHSNPEFVGKLPWPEQERDAVAYGESRERWQNAGYHSIVCGGGYAKTDYLDRCHLTPSGGEKLAVAVSAQVKSIAKELGYIK